MLAEFQSAKSWAVMVIWYGTPDCTSRNSKDPRSPVVTVRGSLLSRFLSSTVALETGPPFMSMAVPTMISDFSSGISFCLNKHTGTAKVIAATMARRIRNRLGMYLVLFVSEYMGAGSLPCTLRFILSPWMSFSFSDHRHIRTMQTARHPETIEKKQGQDIEAGRMLSKMT